MQSQENFKVTVLPPVSEEVRNEIRNRAEKDDRKFQAKREYRDDNNRRAEALSPNSTTHLGEVMLAADGRVDYSAVVKVVESDSIIEGIHRDEIENALGATDDSRKPNLPPAE